MAKKQGNNKVSQTPKSSDGSLLVSIDELKKRFADRLLSPLSQSGTEQFASVTHDVLKDAFGELCDMKVKERGGFFKICLNKKGVQEKSTSQVEITVTKDFKFNIHLNDYDHYEDHYFYGEKLTTIELMDEVENFKAFLDGKNMPETSKLEKIEY